MGSVLSRYHRKNKKDGANPGTIIFACYGMCLESPPLDSSEMRTPLECASAVSFRNSSTSRLIFNLMEIKLPNEIDQENSETYSSDGSELRVENFFSSLLNRNLLNPPISRASSSGTWQSFEPTPLTQVLPQLYLGTENDAQQAEKMISLGITHIISIVGGGRYKDFYPNHMYIPLRDNGSSDLLEKLQDSYDFTTESQENGNKLFVHCQLGQNRSASFVIGFLMKSRNLSFYEAYSLLKEKRELIHPHKKYIEQLRQLDFQLYKVNSTPENFLDIALGSKETIEIKHLNFSKADSEAFKRSQRVDLKHDGGVCLPEFDDMLSTSTVQ